MRIGFIGLGDMGQCIVPRLFDAGHEGTGWYSTEAKASPLIDRGMAWVDTPRKAAAAS